VINAESTLADVCFSVSTALSASGITGVLTGGSAAAIYAPQIYMSNDADFVLDPDEPLQKVVVALEAIGYARHGRSRIFVHAETTYTVDFPRGPLAVGRDYVRDTHVLKRGQMQLRILTRFDCIRDRLAHFYHWKDFTALNAAVGVAAENMDEVALDRLRVWTETEGPALIESFVEFKRRLQLALESKQARKRGNPGSS
jgi:hypothetical protein